MFGIRTVTVGDDGEASTGRPAFGDRPAYSGRSTGDERGLAVEIHDPLSMSRGCIGRQDRCRPGCAESFSGEAAIRDPLNRLAHPNGRCRMIRWLVQSGRR